MTTVRHLVLGGEHDLITTFCQNDSIPVPYDRQQHTILTALANCTDCLAVHVAWHTVNVADLWPEGKS